MFTSLFPRALVMAAVSKLYNIAGLTICGVFPLPYLVLSCYTQLPANSSANWFILIGSFSLFPAPLLHPVAMTHKIFKACHPVYWFPCIRRVPIRFLLHQYTCKYFVFFRVTLRAHRSKAFFTAPISAPLPPLSSYITPHRQQITCPRARQSHRMSFEIRI